MFKYGDICLFQNDNYMFSFDLKSGYHYVEIYEPHRCYLGFQWFFEGRAQFFCIYCTAIWFGHCMLCLYQIIATIGKILEDARPPSNSILR